MADFSGKGKGAPAAPVPAQPEQRQPRAPPERLGWGSEGWSWESICPFPSCFHPTSRPAFTPFHWRAEELGNTLESQLRTGRKGQPVHECPSGDARALNMRGLSYGRTNLS